MLSQLIKEKVINSIIWAVLILAIIALAAELLPEVKAKLIVIPTLLLVIGLTISLIWKNNR